MTPDDVAAIRAEWADSFLNGDPLTEQIRTLCDALEEAWAERDSNQADWENADELARQLRERAERAERWRDNALDQLSMALASLTRVREVLCSSCWCCGEVLAAIEGEISDGSSG